MQDLVDQDLGLIFFAKAIKPFRENLNDVMRSLVEGELLDSRKSVTASDHSSTPRPFAPQPGQPGLIDMGQLQLPEDLFHPRINIFGPMVLNHKQEEMAARQSSEDYRKGPPLSRIKIEPLLLYSL